MKCCFFKTKGRAARTYLKSSLKISRISTCDGGACVHALFKTERGNGCVSYAVAILLLLQTCRWGPAGTLSMMARCSGADQVKAPWPCIASRLSRAKIKCSICSSQFNTWDAQHRWALVLIVCLNRG